MRSSPNKPLVFVVDDVPENIQIALSHLKGLGLEFAYATSGEQALARIQQRTPDLILMDVMMPGMDGFTTMQELCKLPETQSIPVIFLTARSEPEDVVRGFELGGVDYITKPFHGVELRSRVRNHLELHSYRVSLEQKVLARTRETTLLKDITILAMGELAEHRDTNTGGHINRTRFFVKKLAEALFERRKFTDILTQEYIVLLYKTAPLHDIGKVAIRDSILLKEGRLSAEEFAEMKKHTIYGEEVIDKLAKMAGEPMAFLECARDMVGSHHERYDGSGYPRALKGEDIPLAGRIMAVADVYDALRTSRSYKKALGHEEAMYIMATEEGRERHFDPDVYDAFLAVELEFARIAEEHSAGIK
ncbi:MAG: HD domain-containing phosphohydrolase [Candidatus Electrothrix sp. GW3-4]|uniref:response regulator n=1 Tax=Candidatus Electrothrix sp. GW3-4 TaxID=3126740 RepID=UPI0030D3AF04